MEKESFRTSRAAQGRGFESRVAQERPTFVFATGSRFNIPESVRKNDTAHVYSYVVYSSGNVDQRENYYSAIERGLEPVPASEHPELARLNTLHPFDRKEETDQVIKKGGQIMMKRKTEIHEAENDYYDAEMQRQHYMSDMYQQTDPRYPKPFLDKRHRGRD